MLLIGQLCHTMQSCGSVGGFKGAVTRFVRKLNPEFHWQDRFHDHIIRSEEDFIRISNYIVSNPIQWKKDKFNI